MYRRLIMFGLAVCAAALLALGIVLWTITWYTHGRHQELLDATEIEQLSER